MESGPRLPETPLPTWHTLDVEAAAAVLRSTTTGLAAADAAARLAEHGPNELETRKRISAWATFAAQFKNVLVLILLSATIVSGFLGHALESTVITVIVLFAVGLGFIQEHRAGRALEALRQMAAPTARVLRDGEEVVVPANYNSPGQIVIGGDAAAVDRALALLAEKGVRKAVKLAVSVPSHTPLMREAANRLAETMAGLDWRVPALPVVQNVDARVHDGIDAIRTALVQQLYLPVQWTGCVEALAARGVTRVAECGPGKVLSGLIKRIDKSLDARTLSTPADFETARETWAA